MSQPLIVIVGPTGSGKSALAMQIARQYRGEIICADSRTVYKGMDIGTAKPSANDRAEVPHHLLDLVEPDQRYSAAEFQRAAGTAITEIRSCDHLPIIVGGTGLYVDAVVYDYKFPIDRMSADRAALEQLSIDELQSRVDELDASLNHSDYHNRRRLIRAIETDGLPKARGKISHNTFMVGLDVVPDQLESRLTQRTGQMFADGIVAEIEGLLTRFGPDAQDLSGIGYHSVIKQITGELPEVEARSEIIKESVSFAKRQRTWFKRNHDIHWFSDPTAAKKAIAAFIAKAL